jgi:hypothetical protein
VVTDKKLIRERYKQTAALSDFIAILPLELVGWLMSTPPLFHNITHDHLPPSFFLQTPRHLPS